MKRRYTPAFCSPTGGVGENTCTGLLRRTGKTPTAHTDHVQVFLFFGRIVGADDTMAQEGAQVTPLSTKTWGGSMPSKFNYSYEVPLFDCDIPPFDGQYSLFLTTTLENFEALPRIYSDQAHGGASIDIPPSVCSRVCSIDSLWIFEAIETWLKRRHVFGLMGGIL